MSSANDAAVGLNALFTFVAALCSILIFFAAWLSFDANIRYGPWQFQTVHSPRDLFVLLRHSTR